MLQRQLEQGAVLVCETRRPVSHYELARMVVTVIQELVREGRAFTVHDITQDVRRQHPDCDIRHYDRTWDGAALPWQPGEPYHRKCIAIRGVQSLVHELMGVHLSDEYTYRAIPVPFGRYVEQYMPASQEDKSQDRLTAERWGDAA